MSSHSEPDDDPFLVAEPLEIRSILRSVHRRATLLRMYARDDQDASIITTILEIDDTTKRVVVECASDTELNERLLTASVVAFDTQVDQVHIDFQASETQSCFHDGLPAISFPYPEKLRRVQRREYFRLEIPVNEPLSCIIPLVKQGQAPGRAEIKVKDIGAGGLALMDPDNLLPHETGITFEKVRLRLPEVGEVTIDLEVRHVHNNVIPSRRGIIELGCRFVGASNATTMLIQSYIGRLERRLNAKQRGF